MTQLKPLAGLKVLEFDAIGPVPFCGMMLADHGADITRVTRPGGQPNGIDAGDQDILLRGRNEQIPLDLKSKAGAARVLELVSDIDVVIEGHRPGVMERLRIGLEECHAVNPALVYCRITGYGQTGLLVDQTGHDINYVAQTGALHAIGARDHPPPPLLSLVGDFAGGGMMGAFGVLAAVLAARDTGKGSVIDVAMVDGAALTMAMTYGWINAGLWTADRESNLLDGGAPFYCCYKAKNGRFVAAGAIEPKFYAIMCKALNLTDPLFADQMNQDLWPKMKAMIGAVIANMDEDDLRNAVDTPDACLSWVVALDEVGCDDHLAARKTIVRDGALINVAAAPRFAASKE